jgi:5-methylcytosine-specific restriction endonuclease McrA
MSFIKKNWNDNNQERNKIINQAWVEKNRDRVRSINNKASLRYYYFGNGKVIRFNRRAKEKNAKGSFTLEEWQDLLKKFNHVCPMCRLKEPEIKLTVDHIIPISIGGTNYISNIQPLCKVCNSIKGIKTIDLRALAII